MRNKRLVKGPTTAVETASELVDVEEDEEELEPLPISIIRSKQKRIEEPTSIEPLELVDIKSKGQATALKRTSVSHFINFEKGRQKGNSHSQGSTFPSST